LVSFIKKEVEMSNSKFSITQNSFQKQIKGYNDTVSRMSGARFIAETFKGYQVTHIFYVEAILRRALVEMEELGIQRILTHSEKAAAYMADGYARVSHRPGICMAQSVGAANLASGLQDPYLGLSPVIAITGRRTPIAQHRNAYQEISHGPMFDPVTKYNVIVETVEQLPYLLPQAFREATSGAPGPVHLDVMGNLGEELAEAEADLRVVVEEQFKQYPSMRPEPQKESIREAVRFIKKAERPMIVAGGGVIASSAEPDVVKFAEMLSIPVATSLNGKGTILENHPLSVGVVGSYSRGCANRVVSEADLVLFIGSHTGDQVTNNWTVPHMGTPVIQIDIDPVELGRSYPNTVGIMGDAKVTLRRVIEFISHKSAKSRWASSAQQLVKEWHNEFESQRNSDASPIRVERLCKELTDFLPSNAILVSDTGYAGIWTGAMVYLTHSEQSYIRAAGSLGWAFPASLGAKCAAPERPVVCFIGDGGFWYHLSEMETACRRGIKTVTVVNNNHCLRQCLEGVNRAYGGKLGNRDEMCMYRDVNFARIAQEMGCLGIRVEQPGEISGALKKALISDQPAVVDIVTDLNCKAPSAWTPPSN
jgi:acetolactate synthase-1/2/3 large subunit